MLQQSFVSGSGGDTYCRQAWAVLSVKGAVIDEKKSAQTGEDDIIKKQEVKSAEEGARRYFFSSERGLSQQSALGRFAFSNERRY